MRRRVTRPALCQCGRMEPRHGQRDCRLCHAEDMKRRRDEAKARGTYTLKKVPRDTPRGADSREVKR